MKIVSRAEWGAKPARSRHVIETPTPRLWLHHTASEVDGPSGVREIQRFHQTTKRWTDIAYSFLVDDDGTVYEGRGVGIAGGHTKGDNTTSHAICAMGNFDVRPPTQKMLVAIAGLTAHGYLRGWWADSITGGHQDAPGAQTACPGRFLQAELNNIRALVARSLHSGGDDLTPDQDRMLRELYAELVESKAGKVKYMVQAMNHQVTQDRPDTLFGRIKKLAGK